ncbi:MAG TPA: hypothetical protein VE152_01530 [Acidimicrobiales bacterium]|jgi:hypothetical protein|nr:hypothetical protein [Acidimicrobiales bacterium]
MPLIVAYLVVALCLGAVLAFWPHPGRAGQLARQRRQQLRAGELPAVGRRGMMGPPPEGWD